MRVMIMLPLAALSLAPATVHAASEPPVACIYSGSHNVPRDHIAALVKNGLQAKTEPEKDAMATIGESVGNCRTKYGWGQKRQDAAVRYLSGRVLREDALTQGKAVGLTPELLDGFVAKLDASGRTAYTTEQVTAAMNGAAVTQLRAAGINIDAMPPADQQKVSEMLEEGVAGTIVEQDSTVQFNH